MGQSGDSKERGGVGIEIYRVIVTATRYIVNPSTQEKQT